jgi:cytochrome P450
MVVPVVPISLESVTPDPDKFDGFRYYHKREEPGQRNLHQFATTDKNNLHFGHGKYSCPGRFFAGHTIKVLIAHLIMNYDVTVDEDKGRPLNVAAHEYIFPDPEARILFKERSNPLSY